MSVVIKGNVTVKPHGIRKQKPLTGNWGVLHDGGGKDTPPCIELFEAQTSALPSHTLSLQHLKFADKSYRQQEVTFLLSIKKEKYHFQFDNVEDKEDWVQSLCHVSQDLWKQRASTRESSEIESDSVGDMSENVLYDSCDKVLQFKVSINPNKTSEALDLKGHYMLNPTQDSLRLLEMDSTKSVHDWPYRQIRKYGCTRKIFKMEVGRRCTTGAGEFEFFTPDGSTLSELIAGNIRQAFSQEHRQLEAAFSAPPRMDAVPARMDPVESLTSSQRSEWSSAVPARMDPVERLSSSQWSEWSSAVPARMDPVESLTSSQQSERSSDHVAQRPPVPSPHHASENVQDSQTKDSRGKGSTSSVDSKPRPVPRSSINKSKKENTAENGTNKSSDDTKIYETSSGLTAPLNSQLKQELNSKLYIQSPAPSEAAAQGPQEEVEDDPVSDATESSTGLHGSRESIKDKKKSEKERKKREKEQKAAEAKRKKQEEKQQKEREKELKEEKEREAKEEKERQKRLKKESKAREKLKSKKSLDNPVPEPAAVGFSDGNIYDEPGELLLQENQAASTLPPDPGYCEASDIVPGLPKTHIPGSTSDAASVIYATPNKSKNSWKTHARPDSDHIHQEDYDAIKRVSQSQRPPIPSQLQSASGVGEEDDTYDHLGGFKLPVESPENVYGMASARDTVQPTRPTVVGENEYEEAETVCSNLGPRKVAREVRDEYEETDVPPKAAVGVSLTSEGDYAEVSHS